MVSVKRVYEVLKDLANKEQRGFISPSEFNSMAPVAQMAIYRKMWGEVLAAEQLRMSNDGARDLSKARDVREELTLYLKSNLKFNYPDDFYKLSSAKTYGSVLMGTTTSLPIEITYDPFRIDYMLKSTLSAPSLERPVILVADKLEVYPNSIKKIDIRYYKLPEGITSAGAKTPSQPQFNYTTVAGDEVYNAATSIDFELPKDREEELVVELATMIGTALRDAAVMSYGKQQG
jgi:hypothetical protein